MHIAVVAARAQTAGSVCPGLLQNHISSLHQLPKRIVIGLLGIRPEALPLPIRRRRRRKLQINVFRCVGSAGLPLLAKQTRHPSRLAAQARGSRAHAA
jgi:hypothetical protein